MKKILLASVAALTFAGAASAADLRAPIRAPVVAPVYNWTGCYIGGFIGGAWNAENVSVLDNNGYNNAVYNVGPFDRWNYDLDSSFIGGGTLGCNWQPIGSPLVLGLEGEIGYMKLTGQAYDPIVGFQAFPGTLSSTKVGDWYGIIAPRLGYAWDRAMVYLKGGVAFVDVDVTVVDPVGAAQQLPSYTDSSSVATWTIGGGLEYAFDWNWTLKAEYMYIGLEDTRTVCGLSTGIVNNYCFDHEFNGVHTAKVGLNYKFGYSAPLVARY